MTDALDEKEQILERLPEWYRILREIYVRNFDKDQEEK